jgi:hypothetical protein
MNKKFRRYAESLDVALQELISMQPVALSHLPRNMPQEAIYLFSERGRHMYVGRTKRLRLRLQQHCRPSATHYSATFAFLLAREATGRTDVSLASRSDLEGDREFHQAFLRAKERVRRMDVRFVEERDPIRQALLEIYVAVALNTPYNNFETH